MKVGAFDIMPVWDGLTSEPADSMLMRPGIKDPWSAYPGAVDKRGHLVFVIGSFLIRSADRIVLVDAGVGKVSNGHHCGGHLIDSLATHGVRPENIDDVLLSHLHFDHVGWTTQQGRVVFPKATYHVHALDWHRFVEGPEAQEGARRKLKPLESQLSLFDDDCELVPGIEARHCPGHTPGHASFIVRSDGAVAYLLNDTVHSTVEICERDWVPLIDEDQEQSIRTRNAILDEVCDTDALVVGTHFPGMRFGRVVTTAQGRRFVPV